MSEIVITKDNVIALLEQAVAERGEGYIDPSSTDRESVSCTYVRWDDEGHRVPGCIVGLALFKAGGDLDLLLSWDVHISELTDSVKPEQVRAQTGVEIDDDALNAFRMAQDRQDSGKTWGVALQAAKEALSKEPADAAT